MKYLLDTNIIIPLEPTDALNLEASTPAAFEFTRLAQASSQDLYYHPASRYDFDRDSNQARRLLRNIQLGRYVELPYPPAVSDDLAAIIGAPALHSNDWVDNQMIAALAAGAVDFLVSEDRGLRSKATAAGLGARALDIEEALASVRNLFPEPTEPPPAVEETVAHTLDPNDEILDSFRADYPTFDDWFEKCRRQHRKTWVIRSPTGLAAFCIIKPEESPFSFAQGKVLKICAFKVSEYQRGRRLGELLLKTVFEYAYRNGFRQMYLTTFPRHGHLVEMMEEFGFVTHTSPRHQGELVLYKTYNPPADGPDLDPLELHRRYGPYRIDWDADVYIIPIQPRFHVLLFPECEGQLTFFPGQHGYGNSIRKAYLCHSNTRTMAPGDVLLFYRSGDEKRVTVVGVTEDVLISSDPQEVTRAVAGRTVYSHDEITGMCDGRRLLVVLFRYAWKIDGRIQIPELRHNNVLSRAPQSVTRVRREVVPWLQVRTAP